MSMTETAHVGSKGLAAALLDEAYWPTEPRTLEETGLNESMIESLICQLLLTTGTLSGRRISERLGLPFGILETELASLRTRQIIAHARPAAFNDFHYSLTENGQKRAQMLQRNCSYSGPAPVPLTDYVVSVEAQAGNFEPIRRNQLVEALSEITYEESWLDFVGPAINSNCGIFLYGPPGNGKSTLAKCLTAARGQHVWIPYSIIDDGVIIKLFDQAFHQKINIPTASSLVNLQDYDRRWVRIRRPTVVVGGELTLESMEIRHDPRSNTCEAPLQMKSNCGCMLIDDFGRQRIAPAELLNRWIVPLESRVDYLNLPTGKKICIPFEQTILFSTNLQPEHLVDEAFMRRVPFKIEIGNPSEAEFRVLFQKACEALGFPWRPQAVDHLLKTHYKNTGRQLRRCHARDLLAQVRSYCVYRNIPLEVREAYLDLACRNYFGSSTADRPPLVLEAVATQATPPPPRSIPVAAASPAAPQNRPLATAPMQQPAPNAAQGQPGQNVRPPAMPPQAPPSVVRTGGASKDAPQDVLRGIIPPTSYEPRSIPGVNPSNTNSIPPSLSPPAGT